MNNDVILAQEKKAGGRGMEQPRSLIIRKLNEKWRPY
jgi:hypothetical protein